MVRRFDALKKSGRSGELLEFFGNDNPKCPHCGVTSRIDDNEWYELYEEGMHEVTCPDCDLDFSVSTSVSYSFTTENQ